MTKKITVDYKGYTCLIEELSIDDTYRGYIVGLGKDFSRKTVKETKREFYRIIDEIKK